MRGRWIGVALAAIAATATAGCSGCKKKPPPEAKASDPGDGDGDEARPDRNTPARVPARAPTPRVPGARVRHAAPLALPDAVAAMPPLDARALGEPAMTPSGHQARFTYCIDAGTVEDAGASVKARLEASGWTRVTARPPTTASASPRYGVAGQKDDLRLSVTVQAVRRSGCDASVNQYFAVASMNRIAAGAPDEPTPPTAAPPEAPAEPPRPLPEGI